MGGVESQIIDEDDRSRGQLIDLRDPKVQCLRESRGLAGRLADDDRFQRRQGGHLYMYPESLLRALDRASVAIDQSGLDHHSADFLRRMECRNALEA